MPCMWGQYVFPRAANLGLRDSSAFSVVIKVSFILAQGADLRNTIMCLWLAWHFSISWLNQSAGLWHLVPEGHWEVLVMLSNLIVACPGRINDSDWKATYCHSGLETLWPTSVLQLSVGCIDQVYQGLGYKENSLYFWLICLKNKWSLMQSNFSSSEWSHLGWLFSVAGRPLQTHSDFELLWTEGN